MKKRNVLHSPRLVELKKDRRRTLRNKFLLAILGIVVIFSSLVYVSRLNKLNIREIKISGNEVIETSLINDVVKNNINGYYLYFVPKSNFLLFPENKIKTELAFKFKRLESISLNLDNSGVLSISLTERRGQYIWCGENLPDITIKPEDTACFFIDKSGYVFDSAPYFSGSVYLKFFGKLNDSYFSPEIFEELINFKDRIINMGVKVSSIFVKDDGDIEVYLFSSKLPPGAPKIIFKNNSIFEKLAGTLQAALITDPLMSDFKNKYSSLLYINLRFGNKVYFKFSQ